MDSSIVMQHRCPSARPSPTQQDASSARSEGSGEMGRRFEGCANTVGIPSSRKQEAPCGSERGSIRVRQPCCTIILLVESPTKNTLVVLSASASARAVAGPTPGRRLLQGQKSPKAPQELCRRSSSHCGAKVVYSLCNTAPAASGRRSGSASAVHAVDGASVPATASAAATNNATPIFKCVFRVSGGAPAAATDGAARSRAASPLMARAFHATCPAHTTSQNIDSSGVSILAGLHYSVRHPWESEEDFLYERSKMSLTISTPSTRNSRLFSHTSSVCRTGRQPPTGWLVATAAAELFGPFLKTQTKKRRFLVIPLPHHARRVHVNWRESASRSSGQLFHG